MKQKESKDGEKNEIVLRCFFAAAIFHDIFQPIELSNPSSCSCCPSAKIKVVAEIARVQSNQLDMVIAKAKEKNTSACPRDHHISG